MKLPNPIERWRIQQVIERSAPAREGGEHESPAERYSTAAGAVERRLRNEAAQLYEAPADDLFDRTMLALYRSEFRRRHRQVVWWRTSQGGSALVAASVLIAGVLFAVIGSGSFTSPPTRRAEAPQAASAPAIEEQVTVIAQQRDEQPFELRALVSPQWVFDALSPESLRQELGEMADGALRAADYIVSQFAGFREQQKAPPRPLVLPDIGR